MKHMLRFFLIFTVLLSYGHSFGQNTNRVPSKIVFTASEFQQFGFDESRYSAWNSNYDSIQLPRIGFYTPAHKSVGYEQTDLVDAVFLNKRIIYTDSLSFEISKSVENGLQNSGQAVRFVQKNDSSFTLFLPERKYDYVIIAKYKGNVKGVLHVYVYKPLLQKVVIVPMVKTDLIKDSLESQLQKVYQPANIIFDLSIAPLFKLDKFDEKLLFDNPSPTNDRYTLQMQEIRDAYFKKHPNADKQAYYVFIIPGFVNPSLNGYMVVNTAMAFVKVGDSKAIGNTITRQLGHGIGMLNSTWLNDGPLKGTTDNLMDAAGGKHLTYFQWSDLRHSVNSYSFYDNYEKVVTNNGMVAYFFWEEDKNGYIKVVDNDLLGSIHRPYKKNYFSYHLEVDNFLFYELFVVPWFNEVICSLHIIAFVLIFTVAFLLRRKFHRYLRFKFRRSRLLRIGSRLVFIGASIAILTWFFYLIRIGFTWFEVGEGEINVMHGINMDDASAFIKSNENKKGEFEVNLSSELLVKQKNRWVKKIRKKVLYFSLQKDEKGEWTKCKLEANKDSLVLQTMDLRIHAQNHYIVFNYLDENSALVEQKVYNHLGVELTKKLRLQDPAKRILIFVNGYRPTSIGHNFKDYFNDISANGLEHPNSDNMIYDFDRFGYWNPWQAIDELFQKRINPVETYYADGHFSVSTSNHESLVNFTTTASIYPKRCTNSKKHTCYTTTLSGSGLLGSKIVPTYDLHRTKPNKKGFSERRSNGMIAGRNILQLLNELPNKSKNDTLYIVAHSMGYAYSLGMIDVLRGRIQFGGFYIIAPENASAGFVQTHEWEEIWQYGSNLNPDKPEAPCLQDGVAPQARVGGLYPSKRVYIPKKNYREKGFFDSHFIGYYKWILDIKAGKPGAIRQR